VFERAGCSNETGTSSSIEITMSREGWTLSVVAVLSACGGQGSKAPELQPNSPPPAQGYLKALSIRGLSYQPAGVTLQVRDLPVTDAAGHFTLSGDRVRFSVGGVDLGGAPVRGLITWLDLSTDIHEFTNKARFLILLDEDGTIANGISIPPQLTARAATWSVNFKSEDLQADLAQFILPELSSLYGRTPRLPTPEEALAAFTAGFQCVYTGLFHATFIGTEPVTLDFSRGQGVSGDINIVVSAPGARLVGQMVATSYPHSPDALGFDISTAEDLSLSAQPTFGTLSSSPFIAHLFGRFTTPDALEGGYSYIMENAPGYNGPIENGRRVGGSARAVQRFVTRFNAQAHPVGLLLEIDAQDGVSGAVLGPGNDEHSPLSGSVNAGVVSASSASGQQRFTGQLTSATPDELPTLSGTWRDDGHAMQMSFPGGARFVSCAP
jgi:hypothetical protein